MPSPSTDADNALEEGPFCLVQPSIVAEAVWRCYQGDPRMHWYVPDEIEDVDKENAASPEAMRDARIAMLKAGPDS